MKSDDESEAGDRDGIPPSRCCAMGEPVAHLVALLCALLANLTPASDKAVVFAAAFLPQFVPSHALVLAMLPLLALVWILVETRRAVTQGWSGW